MKNSANNNYTNNPYTPSILTLERCNKLLGKYKNDVQQSSAENNVNNLAHLIQKKNDINTQNDNGNAELNFAITTNSHHAVQILLEHDAKTMIANKKGDLPLHNAANKQKCQPYFKLLTQKTGKMINAQNTEGKTPLHLAAFQGSYEQIEILLKNGADVNIECKGKQTPIDKAFLKRRVPVITLLASYGAKISEQNKIDANKIEPGLGEKIEALSLKFHHDQAKTNAAIIYSTSLYLTKRRLPHDIIKKLICDLDNKSLHVNVLNKIYNYANDFARNHSNSSTIKNILDKEPKVSFVKEIFEQQEQTEYTRSLARR